MEKITIIVPCYNGARTLCRCLDSVLAQTYHNFEVIFINDGSTDSTGEIAEDYARRDSRFRIVNRPENRGVSSARNLGLSLATGDYIQFLDADDEMLPKMLETLHTALLQNAGDIAVCNYTGNPLFLAFVPDHVFDLSQESDLLEYYQETFCLVLPWNKLFRRSVITVQFDEEVHFAEDELFNLAVLKHARRVVCVNQPLYIYHFAPADQAAGEAVENDDVKSCLNQIIDNTDENSKNSIWYKGQELLPKRREILRELRESGLNFRQIDDLLYTRVFDFFFWELSAFAYMKTDRELVYNEVYHVLREPEFIKSLEVQRKYGVQYLKYDAKTLRERSRHFVDICLYTYNDIAENGRNIKFYEVFILAFIMFFCRETEVADQEYNQLSKLLRQFYDNTTPEAAYMNGLLEKAATQQVTTA